MKQCMSDVRAFHKKVGHPHPSTPLIPSDRATILRVALICEEFDETIQAIKEKDIPEIAKELCDLVYVTVGTAVTYGIDLAPVWDEVHASNMKKGRGWVTPSGKIRKPKNWVPPDIRGVMFDQGWSG